MNSIYKIKNVLIVLSVLLYFGPVFSQSVSGIGYQAVIRDGSGFLVVSGNVDLKIGIHSTSASGLLVYEEIHNLITSSQGLADLQIGSGSSTGAGTASSLSDINWGGAQHYLNIQLDIGSTGTYTDAGTTQFLAVPYAFHSATTDQEYALSQLIDVDTSGIANGHTLTWDGSNWVASKIDSVDFAETSNYASFSDTAIYAISTGVSFVDTAQFAYHADTSNYASYADNALHSDSSSFSDTSGFSYNCLNSWDLNGNVLAGTEFIGSLNAEDVLIKTNGLERMRITSDGKIGINYPTPEAQLHIVGDDGLMVDGNLGSGVSRNFNGVRLVWYPRKAHFYAGGGGLADANIGDYSFGSGFGVVPSGDYAAAFGYYSTASGLASFATGYDSKATGDYSFAQGQVSRASGEAAVAMGRQANSSGLASVALGYHPLASEDFAVAIGNYCEATDTSAYAFGYRAKSNHKGSFIYSDQSASNLYSTAENQFLVRAAGGTTFYSSSDLSTGVVLAGGAGAWATVSDSTKKENIQEVNYLNILSKLSELEVYEWNYKTQNSSIRHLGPMSQDFYATFGFGESDTTITTTDIDGVNMAALKELYLKSLVLEKKASEFDELKRKYNDLKAEKDKIYDRLEAIERKLIGDTADSK
jgi:trimeric autotransporter adhesin